MKPLVSVSNFCRKDSPPNLLLRRAQKNPAFFSSAPRAPFFLPLKRRGFHPLLPAHVQKSKRSLRWGQQEQRSFPL